jgi:hypothetical protein
VEVVQVIHFHQDFFFLSWIDSKNDQKNPAPAPIAYRGPGWLILTF